jgi:hypothetical protein
MGWSAKLGWRLQGLPRNPRELDRSLALLAQLRSVGWSASTRRGLPLDAHGQPIPWLSYPALHWLFQYVQPSHDVFEFGAGHSTLWFAKHARHVFSVEHDAAWANHLRPLLPPNAELSVASAQTESGEDMEGEYLQVIRRFDDGFFDLVLIDGMERCGCARACIPKLKESGVVVFDNSDRPANYPGLEYLNSRGFARVDFVGLVPGYWHPGCTSVFFKPPGPFATSNMPPDLGH